MPIFLCQARLSCPPTSEVFYLDHNALIGRQSVNPTDAAESADTQEPLLENASN